MSVTLAIYDFLAYALPGLIYLYAINLALRLFGGAYIDLEKVAAWPHILLIIAIAFILGHLFDHVGIWFWYRIVYRKENHPQQALDELQQRNDIALRFAPEDWNILLAFIRSNKYELAQYLEKLAIDSIMLRNISTSLLLLGLLQIVVIARLRFSLQELLVGLGIFLLSYLAIRRSLIFRRRFYKVIFEQALVYGSSLQQVLGPRKEPDLMRNSGKAYEDDQEDRLIE